MPTRRYPPLTKEFVLSIFRVDTSAGRVWWTNPPKYHPDLRGVEARTIRRHKHNRKIYMVVQIGKRIYKRSYLIFVVATGKWPVDILDHIDSNSTNDAFANLREANTLQNNWNHPTRAKKSPLPMGVRQHRNGKYQARLGFKGKNISLGYFFSVDEAANVYESKRRELFGEFYPQGVA